MKQQSKTGGKNSKLIDASPHQFVFAECNSSIPTLFQMVPNFIPIYQVLRDTGRPCFSVLPCSLLPNYTVCSSTFLAPGSVKAGTLTLGDRRRGEDFFHPFSSSRYFLHSCKQNVIGFRHLLKSSVYENFTISSKYPFLGWFFPQLQILY